MYTFTIPSKNITFHNIIFQKQIFYSQKAHMLFKSNINNKNPIRVQQKSFSGLLCAIRPKF